MFKVKAEGTKNPILAGEPGPYRGRAAAGTGYTANVIRGLAAAQGRRVRGR